MRKTIVACFGGAGRYSAPGASDAQNLLSNSELRQRHQLLERRIGERRRLDVQLQRFPGFAASSGSAQVANVSASAGNGIGMEQCGGAVTAGSFFDFGGRVFIPVRPGHYRGRPRRSPLVVGRRAARDPRSGLQPRLSTTSLDAWVSLAATNEQAPVGAVSVQFTAFPSKIEAGGTLVARFDRLYVGPPGTTPVALSGFSVD